MKRVTSTNLQEPGIVCVDSWKQEYLVRWDFEEIIENDLSLLSYMEEQFIGPPSVDVLKKMILNYYNEKCDQEILNGFEFEGEQVWLSMENQFNYKAAFDLAVHTGGDSLPVRFKFGSDEQPIYKIFETIESLRAFVISMIAYIGQTQSKFWLIKENINWVEYSV